MKILIKEMFQRCILGERSVDAHRESSHLKKEQKKRRKKHIKFTFV